MDPRPELSLSGRRHHTPLSLRTPEDIRWEIEKVQRQIDKLETPADKSTVRVSDDDNTVPKNIERPVKSVTEPVDKRSLTLPTIKLESYDGSTVRDRLCHLKASLEGQAGQVLWQLSPEATEQDIVTLLRNRFGHVNQMERFRAELHARRHKKGETIPSVYNDIRRLLALSFPGQSGELCEIIGRDAFLTALGDPQLRVRVLDQSP